MKDKSLLLLSHKSSPKKQTSRTKCWKSELESWISGNWNSHSATPGAHGAQKKCPERWVPRTAGVWFWSYGIFAFVSLNLERGLSKLIKLGSVNLGTMQGWGSTYLERWMNSEFLRYLRTALRMMIQFNAGQLRYQKLLLEKNPKYFPTASSHSVGTCQLFFLARDSNISPSTAEGLNL